MGLMYLLPFQPFVHSQKEFQNQEKIRPANHKLFLLNQLVGLYLCQGSRSILHHNSSSRHVIFQLCSHLSSLNILIHLKSLQMLNQPVSCFLPKHKILQLPLNHLCCQHLQQLLPIVPPHPYHLFLNLWHLFQHSLHLPVIKLLIQLL
jgi:hypothetical protein